MHRARRSVAAGAAGGGAARPPEPPSRHEPPSGTGRWASEACVAGAGPCVSCAESGPGAGVGPGRRGYRASYVNSSAHGTGPASKNPESRVSGSVSCGRVSGRGRASGTRLPCGQDSRYETSDLTHFVSVTAPVQCAGPQALLPGRSARAVRRAPSGSGRTGRVPWDGREAFTMNPIRAVRAAH